MKKVIYTAILMSLGTALCAQTNTKLAGTIDSIYQADQNVQWRYKEMFDKKAPEDSLKMQNKLKEETYIRHLQIIKDMYSQFGYPTFKLVGQEPSHHFFVLVQHADSDPKFQAELLPVLDKLSKKGEILRKDYAYLYDRVMRNTKGKQRYGTQPSYGKGGALFDENNNIILPPDLEDPQNVDKRRKSVGLEPIEKYYEAILELLGRPRKPKVI